MVHTLFLSNKFISYVAFYIDPIQTGFLRGFQKSYGRTGIVIPVKKVHRNGKHRNPEDSCRNYQPRWSGVKNRSICCRIEEDSLFEGALPSNKGAIVGIVLHPCAVR
jgi:hypothetical protein